MHVKLTALCRSALIYINDRVARSLLALTARRRPAGIAPMDTPVPVFSLAPMVPDGLVAGEFARQGDFQLAGELGVEAALGRLDGVPQGGAVMPGFRGTGGEEDGAMYDTLFARVIPPLAEMLVAEPFPGAIGGRSDDAAALASGDNPGAQMVDGHALLRVQMLHSGIIPDHHARN